MLKYLAWCLVYSRFIRNFSFPPSFYGKNPSAMLSLLMALVMSLVQIVPLSPKGHVSEGSRLNVHEAQEPAL